MLDPDVVAARTFGTSFRGFDPDEVRQFLAEVAEELRALASGVLADLDDDRAAMLLGEETARLLAAARSAAAAIETKAEERAAEVLRDAQEEATQLRSTVEAERERAYAEGVARAEAVLADAERRRQEIEEAARAEAAELVAEAEAARELVLGDLARRRKAARAQVEQLQGARDKLLEVFADVQRILDEARGRLVVALPEAKVAADAAARRVEAEPDTTVEQLESELEAFRLAGIPLGPPAGADAPAEEPEPAVEVEAEADVEAEEVETDAESEAESEIYLRPVDVGVPFEHVRIIPAAAFEAPAPEAAALPEDAEPEVEVGPALEAEPEPEAWPEPEPAPGAEPEPVFGPALEARPEPRVEVEPALAAEPEPGVEVEPEVGPEVEPEVLEPAAAAGEADEAPAPEAGAPNPPAATVDALFARLRAEREARTAAAQAVLDSPAPEPEPDVEAEPVAEAALEVEAEPEERELSEREELLARRDVLLSGPTASLAKRLKRVLADEQNAVLDALRRGGVDLAAVPDPADLSARWADAAAVDLAAAAHAGAAFLAGGCPAEPVEVEVADVAADLAAAIAVPLAERLAAAVRTADGDRDLAADAVRSVCREWRSRRLGDGVEHAARVAFGRGSLAAAAPGTRLCWIVDDGAAPCPDAEDNALAGPVPVGDRYPTGHLHPPAHPGCPCVLAAAPTT